MLIKTSSKRQISLLHTCFGKTHAIFSANDNTVKPVLSGPALSGHPVLSGHFVKSRIESHIIPINETSIKRTPLLSGRGHLNDQIKTIKTCVKRTKFS